MNRYEANKMVLLTVENKTGKDATAWNHEETDCGSLWRDPENHYNYICDLGDRFELNLDGQKTENFWFKYEIEKTELAKLEIGTDEAITLQAFDVPELGTAYKLIHTLNGGGYSEIIGSESEAWKAYRRTMEESIESKLV